MKKNTNEKSQSLVEGKDVEKYIFEIFCNSQSIRATQSYYLFKSTILGKFTKEQILEMRMTDFESAIRKNNFKREILFAGYGKPSFN